VFFFVVGWLLCWKHVGVDRVGCVLGGSTGWARGLGGANTFFAPTKGWWWWTHPLGWGLVFCFGVKCLWTKPLGLAKKLEPADVHSTPCFLPIGRSSTRARCRRPTQALGGPPRRNSRHSAVPADVRIPDPPLPRCAPSRTILGRACGSGLRKLRSALRRAGPSCLIALTEPTTALDVTVRR